MRGAEELGEQIQIIEQGLAQFAGAQIDEGGCIIRGVAILRPTSRNTMHREAKGRRYSQRALEAAAKFASGTKAFINHATDRELTERRGVRDVRDILGHYEAAHVDPDGTVRGDLRFLEHHKSWLVPLVRKMSDKVGNSIHATGDLVFDKATGDEVVENLTRLQSIDLVTEPGSTANLFEARQRAAAEDISDTDILMALHREGLTATPPKRPGQLADCLTVTKDGESVIDDAEILAAIGTPRYQGFVVGK